MQNLTTFIKIVYVIRLRVAPSAHKVHAMLYLFYSITTFVIPHSIDVWQPTCKLQKKTTKKLKLTITLTPSSEISGNSQICGEKGEFSLSSYKPKVWESSKEGNYSKS